MSIENPKIIMKATRQDFLDVMEDTSIKNVVLLGHGGWDVWISSDIPITQGFISNLLKENPSLKNSKEKLYRFTCGGDREFRGYSQVPTKEYEERSMAAKEKFMKGELTANQLQNLANNYYGLKKKEAYREIYGISIINQQLGEGLTKKIRGWGIKLTTPFHFLIFPEHIPNE